MKIVSWNVNGIRSAERKGFIEFVERESPDILCIQETKAHPDQLSEKLRNIGEYKVSFCTGEKKGYSGVCIYTKIEPKDIQIGLGNPKYDIEGRTIRMDFGDFVLDNSYYPNGGRGPERVRYKIEFYEDILAQWEELRKQGKKIIATGDFNTAHKEIDLARPKENAKVTGFLPEERAWLDKITEMGYVDIFRKYNQDPGIYTFWDNYTRARERNAGWRIDYFWITPDVVPLVTDAKIRMEVMGSDHCPIELYLNL